MEVTNVELAEVNFIVLVINDFEPDDVTNEGAADEAQTALDFDAAPVTHPSGQPLDGISSGLGRLPVAWREAVKLRWAAIIEGLMRTQVIVFVLPSLEAALLRPGGGSRRGGSFGLEDTVHLLMGAIVLRFGGPGELHADATAQPPNTESGEVQWPLAGEGHTVVDANDLGTSMALEERMQERPHAAVAKVGDESDGKDVARSEIAHGEGLAALSIGGAKPTFKVDRPHLVGLVGRRQQWARHLRPASRARRSGRGESGLLQPAL
jgi:hypothetical protein